LPDQLNALNETVAAVPLAIAQDPELIGDFINEATEHVATIEAEALALERDPASADSLHAAFRGIHTIKGLAGFLELSDIREVTHEVETLLDRARNGELAVTPEMIDVVLETADYLKRSIAWVRAGLEGKAGQAPPFAALLVRVQVALESRHGERNAPAQTGVGLTFTAAPESAAERPVSGQITEPAASTLRVDAAKLDYMMDMVGELVIAQSLITHTPELKQIQSGILQRNLQQLGRITGEVQRVAMCLRMTPVTHLFARMTRLVRDLSRKNGKRARLELSGEETELDKTIIEHLADPLMHMVRNSLDHGLESPEERVTKGKPPEGVLSLSAAHQAGHIVIAVADDGRGLDTEKILRKAREKGQVLESQTPSENEIFHLIFEPGFSTADQVTEVSGRGVGMDVVRRQIQGLRGHIDIQSAAGAGTTFFLRLPLTLAIIDGLIVKVASERFILPISTVREIVRPEPGMLFTIEGRAEMALIRGALLPIVRLDRRFGITHVGQAPHDSLFIITESEGRRFCLVVDGMLGKQEVVIKSLGETFRNVPGISGGAILGDGRVGLILDVNSLDGNNIFREPAYA